MGKQPKCPRCGRPPATLEGVAQALANAPRYAHAEAVALVVSDRRRAPGLYVNEPPRRFEGLFLAAVVRRAVATLQGYCSVYCQEEHHKGVAHSALRTLVLLALLTAPAGAEVADA